jgi:hypothetical protein
LKKESIIGLSTGISRYMDKKSPYSPPPKGSISGQSQVWHLLKREDHLAFLFTLLSGRGFSREGRKVGRDSLVPEEAHVSQLFGIVCGQQKKTKDP